MVDWQQNGIGDGKLGIFNTIDINILALAILLIIYLNLAQKADKYMFDQRLFIALLVTNAVLLILDSVLWALNGRKETGTREIILILTSLYFILNPMPSVLWSLYVNFLIYKDEKKTLKMCIPFSILVGINAIISAISCFYGYTFFIDTNNVYHRGEFFMIMAILSYILLLYTMILIIKKHKTISKNYYIPALVFVVPPFIGNILQSVFYGISLSWASMTVACLIIFINIQNSQLYTDYLTGLFNRNRLDSYLQGYFKGNGRDALLAGIMIDLNSFKRINDIYGHSVGDQALKHTGAILKKSFRESDFVARYGGDEFLVLFNIKNRQDLISAVERIKQNTDIINKKRQLPFKLSLSMGYDVFDNNSGVALNQFFKHIDELMYKDKKKQRVKSMVQ
jgi:diguanylate cyclase (GGDEF)-like protein